MIVMVFRRFPMTSPSVAFSDITHIAGVYEKANIFFKKYNPKTFSSFFVCDFLIFGCFDPQAQGGIYTNLHRQHRGHFVLWSSTTSGYHVYVIDGAAGQCCLALWRRLYSTVFTPTASRHLIYINMSIYGSSAARQCGQCETVKPIDLVGWHHGSYVVATRLIFSPICGMVFRRKRELSEDVCWSAP